MTLFRKVFQNQSRIASGEDALDEAALRDAFRELKEDKSLLKLDPFAQSGQTGAAEGSEDDYEDEEDLKSHDETMARQWNDEEETLSDFYEEVEAEQTDHADESPEPLAGEAAGDDDLMEEEHEPEAVESETDELDAVQSDEEIAACLGRALAADMTAAQETRVVAEEATDLSSDMEEEDEDGAPEPQQAVQEEQEPVDVTRFAQEQMAAIDPQERAPEVPLDLSAAGDLSAIAAPAAGRSGRRAGRVKTRLLGFNRTGDVDHDPFGQAPEATATAQSEKYPVGWLVIVEGPGVGHAFSIFTGASMIGRGEDQVIRLDFGDNSISRQNHAAIAYDEEQNKFYIGHGGKSNIIRRNARPVLSTEELHHADLIRIGETTLRFVALCGSDFQWTSAGGAHAEGV